ncbi:MAG: metalloregulator ArsR/SmtB family transcription factor [Hyphomicrobiales bacterium]|nr:metalloregulator ArsR/SmtB family transcription factor [Hyphomicrobiales bacterium]
MPKPLPDLRGPADPSTPQLAIHAARFAALGDPTRLGILVQLSDGAPRSIARLTEATDLTRQAVTKHLAVLAEAGIVRASRRGRETLFELEPAPLAAARQYLDAIAAQWEAALGRLKSFIEDPPH